MTAPANPQPHGSPLERWAPAAIVALAFVLYLNILPNSFIFDDWQQLFENPYLRQADGLKRIFTTNVWAFEDKLTAYYRPLMHVTFFAALRWFGYNPAGYHVLSILLHAVCSLLVYALVKRRAGDGRVALVAALLFAVHPVHTENVNWISAYPDLQVTLFVLLGWLLYLKIERPWWRAVAVGACFFLALLAKEIAVVLPVVIIADCRLQIADFRKAWRDFAALAVALGAYVALRMQALGMLLPVGQMQRVPLSERIYTSLALFWSYCGKLVWPGELNLFIDAPVRDTFWSAPVIAGTLAAVAFAAALVWFWKKQQPEALGLLLFIGALAPAFTLPYDDMNMMAERYLYLPSVGVCWVVGRRWPRGRVATALLLIVAAALSARTVVRNLDWREEVAFYQKTIAKSPRLAEVRVLLGSVYLRRNNLPAALEAFQDAVRLKPRLAEPRNNLGLVYSRMNQSERAIEEFTLSAQLAIERGHPYAAARTFSNIGIEYRRLGRTQDAIRAYDRALEIEPRLVGARNNRGYALLASGRLTEAEADFRRTLEMEPMFPMAHSNLGLLFLMRGDLPAAEAALQEALRLSPRDPETFARLGDVAAKKGDRLGAQEMYRRALELAPENQRAKAGLVRLGAGR